MPRQENDGMEYAALLLTFGYYMLNISLVGKSWASRDAEWCHKCDLSTPAPGATFFIGVL